MWKIELKESGRTYSIDETGFKYLESRVGKAVSMGYRGEMKKKVLNIRGDTAVLGDEKGDGGSEGKGNS